MKHTIKQLAVMLFVLFVANGVCGQTTISMSGNQSGGKYSGTITLTGPVTLSGSIESSGDLTIDLAGNIITCTGSGHRLGCESGTTLTLKDSKGGGIIIGAENGGDRGGCIYVGGTFNFNGGTLQGFKTNKGDYKSEHTPTVNAYTRGAGGAIYINDGGTVVMDGGIIDGCSTQYTNTADTYTHTTDKKEYTVIGCGGAVFVDADDETEYTTTFHFKSGTIKNCSSGMGGAVYVHAPLVNKGNAVFTMEQGAEIIDCKALYKDANEYSPDHGGGGVMIASSSKGKGTFNLNGGLISGCQSASKGCGVLAHGMMNMTGGTITGCYPVGWEGVSYPNTHAGGIFGGGVFTYHGAVFKMTGGTISQNKAASGGGVMVWGTAADTEKNTPAITSTFIMDGKSAVITENQTIGQGGLGNGGAVYVQAATFNFINGTLSNNKAIRYGGAININSSATLNLQENCIVQGNTASHGGGISQEAGECVMTLNYSGIQIVSNTANGYQTATENGHVAGQGNGGGLFIEKGKLTIDAGTISNNTATGSGGGIAIHLERIAGDATVNINGGTIQSNTAKQVNGGGISMRAQINTTATNDANGKNDIVVNLNKGILTHNTAVNGGCIYIGINDKATANMIIGTANDIPEIKGNTATSNGGAIGMNNGIITIVNGALTDNHSDNGNGGAVFLGAGTFNVTGNATILRNSAVNGGGICVENGEVHIEKGTIQHNKSANYGGGLYVYAPTSTSRKTVKFDGGGILSNNTAKHGGGVCANGPLDVSIAATIDTNTADEGNGGGICLLNTATMSFGDGLIRGNKATATTIMANATAYGKSVGELTGVGGGVFLDSQTHLNFTSTTNFGLYNNRADNAADDIFANGVGTNVVFPAVKNMSLKDFDLPTNQLYWVEDYVKGDTDYSRGTNILPSEVPERYQTVLKKVQTIPYITDESAVYFDTIKGKYLCFALGYQLVFVRVTKQGLDEGDDATFEIFSEKRPDKPYLKIIMTGGVDGADATKVVALPEGKWKFVETNWSWKYLETPEYYYYTNGTLGHQVKDGKFFELTKNQKEILIVNKKKVSDTEDSIREYEKSVKNDIHP